MTDLFGHIRPVQGIAWGFTYGEMEWAVTDLRVAADHNGWRLDGLLRVVGGKASEAIADLPSFHTVRRVQDYGRAYLVYEEPPGPLALVGWAGAR